MKLFLAFLFLISTMLDQTAKSQAQSRNYDFCRPTVDIPGPKSSTIKMGSSYKIRSFDDGSYTVLYTTLNPQRPVISVIEGTSQIWMLTVQPNRKPTEISKQLATLELENLCLEKISETEYSIVRAPLELNASFSFGYPTTLGKVVIDSAGIRVRHDMPWDDKFLKDITNQEKVSFR